MHTLCLAVGAIGLLTIPLMTGKYGLLVSMTCIGIAWSSILSMPYAMLTPALPKDKVGVLMGMFNLFIVFPQIIASGFLGKIVEIFFANNPMNAMLIGGVSFAIASVTTIFVVSYKRNTNENVINIKAGH
jgi:maltose/moltooligosaccharide transporter